MKKLCFLALAAVLFASCSVTTPKAKIISSATHKKVSPSQLVVTPVAADLKVESKKITFFYIPSQLVANGGKDNVINTAIQEALISNGNADVLVGVETQIKYRVSGEVESITVSGYPAKYINFRQATEEDLSHNVNNSSALSSGSEGGLSLGNLKLGK